MMEPIRQPINHICFICSILYVKIQGQNIEKRFVLNGALVINSSTKLNGEKNNLFLRTGKRTTGTVRVTATSTASLTRSTRTSRGSTRL